MKVRHFFFLTLHLIFFSFSLFSKPVTLSQEDVRGIMQQLFEYHIDKKEISHLILERSLKIYIKQFDPTFSYLLQEEVFPYFHPDEKFSNRMLRDYQSDRFVTYFTLNRKIQESILRARSWRQNWEQFPQKLIAEAQKVNFEREIDKKGANSLVVLKDRHYQRLLEFIALQIQDFKQDEIAGKEGQILTLCEKQLAGIENEYLGLTEEGLVLPESMQEHFLVLRILKSLAHSLDAHTAYYSPEEAYAMKVQLEKGMSGIGVVLKEGLEGIIIQDVIPGGPAELSGKINKGDVIVEVDGHTVSGQSFRRILEMMKGKEGTKTILGLLRHSNQKPKKFHVELIRSKIILGDKRVDVGFEPHGDGVIGKITLHSFYEGEDGISSEKDLKKAIDQLRAEGPLYGLILDMRDNTGGFLSQAVKVSGLFLANGVVVISKYFDGSVKYYRTVDGTHYFDGPLVVLVSRGSASATEIVAQALKDYGVAVIVGDEHTYGKGTIQHQTVTNDGSNAFFKVTIGRYYTVSGRSTQIEGVKADILVPSSLNYEEIGETFLEYPLPSDWVPDAYQDALEDIDPMARKWFQKYYLPNLQVKETHWESLIPTLQSNSAKRLEKNKNFQLFLQSIKEKVKPLESMTHGVNDLQMEEAVNIVKDMILLNSTPRQKTHLSPTQ